MSQLHQPPQHVFVMPKDDLSSQHSVTDATTQDYDDDASDNTTPEPHSPQDVMLRIEYVISQIMDSLDKEQLPILTSVPVEHDEDDDEDDIVETTTMTKKFSNLSQCRVFTSILNVMSFVYSLLQSNRTTTTREVYYYFVTHFRSQNECDMAIRDAANLLRVPRHCLGLMASPKGWYCGSFRIAQHDSTGEVGNVTDGTKLSSVHGLPITSEWIELAQSIDYHPDAIDITSDAKCILVVEKEGVYNRLSEDGFFHRYPSILVTGKGFPDVATRALVYCLHNLLDLPVYGLTDCNPYGISVMQTYVKGSTQMGMDGGDRYGVPMQWLGLRPSHVEELGNRLPKQALQAQTELDQKRLCKLAEETSSFLSGVGQLRAEARLEELEIMQEGGYKVELEALHWLGMNYLNDWVYETIVSHDNVEKGSDDDVHII